MFKVRSLNGCCKSMSYMIIVEPLLKDSSPNWTLGGGLSHI